jgi:outer membrane protein OmpA-like peptidoglycan-associated protein
MKTVPISGITATEPVDEGRPCRAGRRVGRILTLSLASAALFACTQSESSAPPQTAQAPAPPAAAAPAPPVAAAPPPLPPILPFDQAVDSAANKVFAAAPEGSRPVVIDPLVDGVTGYTSAATVSIQGRVMQLVRDQYPRFSVEKFSPEALNGSPLVLVGTFTAVNGKNQTTGPREAYRFCLVLGDLKTGKVVAKGVARAQLTDVDATPTPIYHDSPIWTADPSTQAYINTCQATKVGDPISKEFLDGLVGASLVSEAAQAYNASRYKDALELYTAAAETPAGDQLKVYNGLYLANWKLQRNAEASEAFGQLVAYGFRRNRLAVQFLFEPGSTRFYRDPQVSGQYPLWLQQIAQQATKSNSCLEVTGHTSPTGSAALNERLSFLRADYIKTRLETDNPQLRDHLVTNGVGSASPLVGTGKDDASDALDRRVELQPIASCARS